MVDEDAELFEVVQYRYDSNGRRTGKSYGDSYNFRIVGGQLYYVGDSTGTAYYYAGDDLSQIDITFPDNSSTSLHFTYDELGPMSVTYSGAEYFYLKNAQGDVTGLVNSSGTQVVAYTYDAWGNPLSTTGTMADTLGKLNPFRYRGYVYDTETGLYYLGSRYYNPETGRFINADSINLITATPNSATWDKNLFSYCDNNPIIRADSAGGFWHIVVGAAGGALLSGVVQVACNVIEGKSLTSGLGLALLAGAASGALTASGVGVIGSAIGSGMISAGSSLVSQISDGGLENVNFGEVLLDGAVGVGCGIISGAGASSVASGAGGQTQMINLGKKTASRTWSALRTNGVEAAKKEAQKATHYYMKSTKKVTDNLLGKKVRKAFGFSAFYSWDKSLFKRIFR